MRSSCPAFHTAIHKFFVAPNQAARSQIMKLRRGWLAQNPLRKIAGNQSQSAEAFCRSRLRMHRKRPSRLRSMHCCVCTSQVAACLESGAFNEEHAHVKGKRMPIAVKLCQHSGGKMNALVVQHELAASSRCIAGATALRHGWFALPTLLILDSRSCVKHDLPRRSIAR